MRSPGRSASPPKPPCRNSSTTRPAPVILERDGERFRLSRDEDIAYEPDPEAVRATLEATLGSWTDLDVDTMIRKIYEDREASSRPFDRP